MLTCTNWSDPEIQWICINSVTMILFSCTCTFIAALNSSTWTHVTSSIKRDFESVTIISINSFYIFNYLSLLLCIIITASCCVSHCELATCKWSIITLKNLLIYLLSQILQFQKKKISIAVTIHQIGPCESKQSRHLGWATVDKQAGGNELGTWASRPNSWARGS